MNGDMNPVVPRVPRFFWRRAFAFLLDGLLAGILAGFVMLGVLLVSGYDLGAAGFAHSTACEASGSNHPLARRLETLWPQAKGEMRTYTTCHTSTLGLAVSYSFHAAIITRSGNVSYTKSLAIQTDASGNPVPMQWRPDFSLPLMVVILAWFTASGRRPPGKVLLSLAVQNLNNDKLTFAGAMKRETLKMLPLLTYFVVGVVYWLVQPATISDFDQMAASLRDGTTWQGPMFYTAIAIGLFPLIWWIAPFIFWRGQTWYDMLAGTQVVKRK